jgi:orotate phosphoribosyltransferase-like protein
MKPRLITEAEFIAYEDMQLAQFAREIHESGISLYEIAQACNLSWETVKAAANAVPVKFSTQCRIKMYLEYKHKKAN